MLPLLGPLLGGIASGVGNIISTSSANDANREIAAQQMAFQERMSSTSFQRGVKDLEAAGLNKMLAYGNAGASTPSGAGYSAQAPDISSPIGSVVSSALQDKQIENSIKETDSRIGVNDSLKDLQKAQAEASSSTARAAKANAAIAEAQLPAIKAGAKYDTEAAPVDAILKRIPNGSIKGVLDLLKGRGSSGSGSFKVPSTSYPSSDAYKNRVP